MLALEPNEVWPQFLECCKTLCTQSAFNNWLSPIVVLRSTDTSITLQVPNVFVQEYLLSNFKKELRCFLPLDTNGEPVIEFVIAKLERKSGADIQPTTPVILETATESTGNSPFSPLDTKLNSGYRFSTFIEGHSNQFVKSAAIGVATRPGESYNPLFIHGGVGLGKTHLLHSIGHHIRESHKKLRIHCITTEAFINQIVDCLRNKSIDRFKQYYRTVDVLLVDDIQFLQNRPNFEEEFCNTFEALIHRSKQVVVTSDKPPSQLKLSERLVARMEWGLVAHVGAPDLETRVAILQHKAEMKGIQIPSTIAFHIAEHIHHNVRQLEGALNRLSAYSRLLNMSITEDLVEKLLRDMFQLVPKEKLTIENILKSVSCVFRVKVSDLKGESRTKNIVLPRQVAIFLTKELVSESLVMIGEAFGNRTHSTILHAIRNVEKKIKENDTLRRQIDMVRRNLQI